MLVCKDTLYVYHMKKAVIRGKQNIYVCVYIVYISSLLSVHNFCRLLEAIIKENLGNQKA